MRPIGAKIKLSLRVSACNGSTKFNLNPVSSFRVGTCGWKRPPYYAFILRTWRTERMKTHLFPYMSSEIRTPSSQLEITTATDGLTARRVGHCTLSVSTKLNTNREQNCFAVNLWYTQVAGVNY